MSEPEKKILINVEDDERRIATLQDGTLDNLHIEHTEHKQVVGNIYRGVVAKVQTSFQAAFVEYGADRHGFLPVGDLNPQLFKPTTPFKGRPSISQLLRPGQSIMVQVLKGEIGHKGASLTTNISLPGRFMVFMPHSNKGGVSKKIEDTEQRTRLKHLLKGLGAEEASAIIRTAGENRSLAELKRDFMVLRRTWKQIQDAFEKQNKPGLVHKEDDVVIRMLRDYFTEDISEVVIDDPEVFQQALTFFQANLLGMQNRLTLYLGEQALFSTHEIEPQIEQLSHNNVPLPSGGSIVISPTEALVAIDVNSGRSNQEKGIEETALRSNLEAAEEVCRQLRLRNLGGLVVIDFIDMEQNQNRAAVIQRMEEGLQGDKAKWTLGSISKFGLLEMSRQRIASSLSHNWKINCPICDGTGRILSVVSTGNRVLRQLRDQSFAGGADTIELSLPVEIATYLLNKKRKQINQLEDDYNVRIILIPDPDLKTVPTTTPQGCQKTKAASPAKPTKRKNVSSARRKTANRPAKDVAAPANTRTENSATTEATGSASTASDTKQKTTAAKKEQSPKKAKTSKKAEAANKKAEAVKVEEAKDETEKPEETKLLEAVAEPLKIEAPKKKTSKKKPPVESSAEESLTLFSSAHRVSEEGSEEKSTSQKEEDQHSEQLKELAHDTVVFQSKHRPVEESETESAPESSEKSAETLPLFPEEVVDAAPQPEGPAEKETVQVPVETPEGPKEAEVQAEKSPEASEEIAKVEAPETETSEKETSEASSPDSVDASKEAAKPAEESKTETKPEKAAKPAEESKVKKTAPAKPKKAATKRKAPARKKASGTKKTATPRKKKAEKIEKEAAPKETTSADESK